MNGRQRNRLRMFGVVAAYLEKLAGRWNGVPAAVAAHADLVDYLGRIGKTVELQERPRKGLTERKRVLRADLERAVMVVAGPAAALAATTGNVLLAADAKAGAAELSRKGEEDLCGVAMRMGGAFAAVAGELADYGVTPAKLAALEVARLAFEEAATSPRLASAVRTGATKELARLMKEAAGVLSGRLDKLMSVHRESDAEFYAGYVAARVIYDLRGPRETGAEEGS